MSFKEYDHVLIKDAGVTGVIIDIFEAGDGKTYYTVEDDEPNGTDDPNRFDYPQYDCTDDRLELIE